MRTTSRARLLAAVAAAAPFLLLVACGGGDGGSSNDTVPTQPDLVVIAPGGLRFDQKAYTAPAGDIAVEYDNKDSQAHSLIFEDATGKKIGPRLLVAPGKKAGEVVPLAAGAYKLICDIPGHEAGGMKADLTVS